MSLYFHLILVYTGHVPIHTSLQSAEKARPGAWNGKPLSENNPPLAGILALSERL
jgi:hypothetical protein